MTTPLLETIAQSLNYGDLPETWRVPEIERFSPQKSLYDYQADALKNAARALYLYYGEENAWQPTEPLAAGSRRKQNFANRHYANQTAEFSIRQYDGNADRRNHTQNPIFKILAEYITPQGDLIPYHHLINRMCFWMATGSGKTLVMVKIIEYLYRLKQHRQIPPHNILVLAPSNHLIGQIRRTIEEFNTNAGLNIDFVPLRDGGRRLQGRLSDTETVYWHRSDNISDVQKDALTDYRQYENGGKWYVLLDEAHKGGKEDSKRQAYYALMARDGFLFNFSATFTDPEDVVTTVKKYNLEEFIRNGHGKNIYLNEVEYSAFRERGEEISGREKTKIVLKSLITLACAKMRAVALREKAADEALYHLPLMLTLVNSVNTDVENERNDLWAFFSTLRGIASGAIDEKQFRESRDELLRERKQGRLFLDAGAALPETDEALLKSMKITDLREAVFLSRRQGALQFIRSTDDRELAFQMKNADAPFALIRIGDTSKWRKMLLADFEEIATLREKSFFDALEKSSITILMGSRAFFESWDSNRPNVINFINIGGSDAKKFVVQSVGRGVRIEPLQNHRRRLVQLMQSPSLSTQQKQTLAPLQELVAPVETLSLFATNRSAVACLLEGLTPERNGAFERLENFKKSPRPVINGRQMPLFIPAYKEAKGDAAIRTKFAVSENTLNRLKNQLMKTSDSLLMVRDDLSPTQISELRSLVGRQENFSIGQEKDYANLVFLQSRLLSHLCFNEKMNDGVRKLNEEKDIVHFREIQAQLSYEDRNDLNEKIKQTSKGGISEKKYQYWAGEYGVGNIIKEKFEELTSGKSEISFKGLTIKNIAEHYYLPIIIAKNGKADYIRHVIKEKSEVMFLNNLEEYLKEGEDELKRKWDAWMFSKIDEALDDVHIPYYDNDKNDYRRFLPDFVFWMCKGNEYRIVFVDPKGMAYASVYSKIDGYFKLFQENGQCRVFRTKTSPALNVSVKLVLFNPQADEQPAEKYAHYWHNNPAAIFA